MRSTLFTRNIQIIVHILVFPCPPTISLSLSLLLFLSPSISLFLSCSLLVFLLFLLSLGPVFVEQTLAKGDCAIFVWVCTIEIHLELFPIPWFHGEIHIRVFEEKSLAFYGSLIHLRLNSRHLFNHLSDNLDRPDISKAELYKTYMSIRITLRHLSMESDCWSVREKWKTTLHYSRFDLMNCLYMYIRSSVHALA